MTENIDLKNIPETTTVPRRHNKLSVVWIIPLIAAVVALGIAVQRILMEGPTITITFVKAEGLEIGKTFVKYKEVAIGHVTKVELSKDFRKVVVTAKIDKSAAGLLLEDTKFWIEQPRASLSGVSGFGTLLSGNYIGLEPGKSRKEQHEFTGLEIPPSITFDEQGKRFVLKTTTLGSIVNGSPLYYRQFNVGQVIGYDLSENGESINIEVFVRAPYDKYVTDQTFFWQASGIDISMGSEGFSVRTQSFLSMLVGGIAFETPPFSEDAKTAGEKAVFTLFNSRLEAMAKPEKMITPYVLYFNETLNGLHVGAPVTYFGLPVGEVTSVVLEFMPQKNNVRPRVDIVVYPNRFFTHLQKTSVMHEKVLNEAQPHSFVQNAVERGLRAQLRRGNLLTGKLYVALDIFPKAPKVKIDLARSPVEMPVVPSDLEDLQDKLNAIFAKIEKIPIEEISDGSKTLLATTNNLLRRVDKETLPELTKTLDQLERLLANADTTLVGKDAPTQYQLREALTEITRAAQGIRNLTEYLEKNPEALIRGKQEGDKNE
ncbi:MAG: MlaD family protein [Smithella sp.]